MLDLDKDQILLIMLGFENKITSEFILEVLPNLHTFINIYNN